MSEGNFKVAKVFGLSYTGIFYIDFQATILKPILVDEQMHRRYPWINSVASTISLNVRWGMQRVAVEAPSNLHVVLAWDEACFFINASACAQ